jgi:hypothetical protein
MPLGREREPQVLASRVEAMPLACPAHFDDVCSHDCSFRPLTSQPDRHLERPCAKPGPNGLAVRNSSLAPSSLGAIASRV